jgi:uncharacterized LabA/DUF88 family protein
VSPRLRSNWRPPARQTPAGEPSPEASAEDSAREALTAPAAAPALTEQLNEPVANDAEVPEAAAAPVGAPRIRARRTSSRARPQAAPVEDAEPDAVAAPEMAAAAADVAEPEGAAARPRRRQPARRRAATATPEQPAPSLESGPPIAADALAPADAAPQLVAPGEPALAEQEAASFREYPESTLAESPILGEQTTVSAELQPAWEGEFLTQARADRQEAWAAAGAQAPAEADAAGEPPAEATTEADEAQALRPHRRRGQRGRRGRGGRGQAAGEAVEPLEAEPEPVAAAPEYEPLPPPTKRKAPRVVPGMRQPRPAASAENAVDWALGRTPANETASVAPEETEAGAGQRRRRSRRGRGGRGVLNGAPAAETVESEEPAALVSEEQFITAQQRRQQAPPPREDRGRSQLSTFESLVARQNVVLDTLLTRISSFTSIERALTAVEHRLSSQGFGAAGTAAPRVGIFVDVPNIIYAAERLGVTIDFGKLLRLLTHGRELVRASAYSPISDDPMQRLEVQKFVQPFVRSGYRIVTKPLKRFSDGTMKGNFDVELAIDVLTMAERLDVVSLVSGDGDFSRLVDIVGSKGVRVEVAAFGASTSAELRAICDDYIDLGNILSEII